MNDIYNKSTDDLKSEMKSHELKKFLTENEEEFIQPDLNVYIQEIVSHQALSKAELARRSGMSTVYLYQLLSGRRSPSRDRLICLCIGLGSTLEETQEILKRSRFALLYLKVRRDAILIFGLNNHLEINEINDLLYENGEETLI